MFPDAVCEVSLPLSTKWRAIVPRPLDGPICISIVAGHSQALESFLGVVHRAPWIPRERIEARKKDICGTGAKVLGSSDGFTGQSVFDTSALGMK